MNTPARRMICAIVLLVCFAVPALADSVAYTNLGSGGSYDGLDGWDIEAGSRSPQSVASPFTASIGGALSEIDVGLTNFHGANSAVVSVYTDVDNMLGSLLFSGAVSGQPAYLSTSTILTTLSPSSGSLVAGNNYFLVVSTGPGFTVDVWNWNNIGEQGTLLFDTGSGFFALPSVTIPAFDVKVNATTTPEPATWLAIGTGLLGLLGATRRKFLLRR